MPKFEEIVKVWDKHHNNFVIISFWIFMKGFNLLYLFMEV